MNDVAIIYQNIKILLLTYGVTLCISYLQTVHILISFVFQSVLQFLIQCEIDLKRSILILNILFDL